MKNPFRHTPHRKERGSVAIEAAILLPLAVVLIFGFLELYNYHRAAAVLNRVAFTVANGVSIQPELYDRGRCTDTDDVCVYNTIAADLFRPLDFANKGKLEISTWTTYIPSGKNQSVTWKASPEWKKQYKGSGPGNTSASSRLSSQSFPPPKVDDTVVVVEVFYEHEPFAISSRIWSALGGTTEMYSRFVLRPRFGDLRNLSR